VSNTGKLSTRNVKERLRWITFDDIIIGLGKAMYTVPKKIE